MTTLELLNCVEHISAFKDMHIDNKFHITMVFGSVERSFEIPTHVNGTQDSAELKLMSVSGHLYSLLVGINIVDVNENYMHLNLNKIVKPYVCIIEHLDRLGFPFMRITNNDSILSKKDLR